jgi:glycosyltransferase involved in cell wall biosynthesis
MSTPSLVLGMIVRDEAQMLALTLPAAAPHVDAIVAIDTGSRDGTLDVLAKYDAAFAPHAWNGDFSSARNHCIAFAESVAPQAHLLMLDADEALLPRDFAAIRTVIAEPPGGLAYSLPRYEFVTDFHTFNPIFYPDYQARLFPLSQGFTYRGAIHEQLCYRDEPGTALQSGRAAPLPYIHIFHYGKCKPLPAVWLKYENYNRRARGEPPLSEVPRDAVLPASFSHGAKLVFHGERPL